MDMEAQIVVALRRELERQAEQNPSLTVARDGDSAATVEGRLDLEALAMAVAGAVAGGP